MRSNYKRISNYVKQVNVRNRELSVTSLKGITINKEFMPSVANTHGTDLSKYKIVSNKQFAFNPMHVGRDEVLPISMLESDDSVIVSPAYVVFRVKDETELLPEYLMMWCRRSEFDRNAWFTTDSSVRGGFSWKDFCDLTLPVPAIEKQREIVKEYHTIVDRIKLNEQLNQKLEETAQAIYKQWFVDFEFPISKEYAAEIGKPELEGKPYKSSGGEMVWNDELDQEIPKGWRIGSFLDHAKIIMGQSPKGDTYNTDGIGTPLINGPVEFGNYYSLKTKWTDSPTKICMVGDLIVCVRGSTTGRFVKSDGEYCLGRGVCSFQAKQSQYFVDLLYKAKSSEMLKLTTGSTFPNWGRDTLSSFPVIVPTKSLVSRFEQVVSKIIHRTEAASIESFVLDDLKNVLHSKMTKVEATACP